MEHTFLFLEPIQLVNYREDVYKKTVNKKQKPSEIINLAKMLKYSDHSLKRSGLNSAKKEIINCLINQ